MARVIKLSIDGLKQLIGEEKQRIVKEMKKSQGFGPMGDVSKKSKETVEVSPEDLGTDKVKDNPINHYKAQKIEETKLLLKLQKLREQMKVSRAKIDSSKGK